MKPSILARKTHYWATLFLALPVIIVIGSGLLLQVKKHWPWVQPPEQRGSVTAPTIGMQDVLESVRAVPALGVRGWHDINRLDVRVSKGLVKVLLHSGWEAQVDLGTGRVLQTAYRRSDIIETIHDGSFFAGEWSRLGIFAPAGVALLLMWCTGLWMFWLPFSVKRKRRQTAKAAPQRSRPAV